MNYSQGGYYAPPENGNTTPPPAQGWNFGPRPPHFVRPDIWQREKAYIKKLSAMAASSIILFIVFSSVFVGIMQAILTVVSGFAGKGGFDYDAFYATWNSAEFQYLFEIIYSIFIVGCPFFLLGHVLHKKGLVGYIPMGKPLRPKLLPMVVLGAFGVCLAGNILTSYLDAIINAVFGFNMEMPAMPETPHNALGIFLFYLSTAIVPALVEEMALRGIVMQPLRRYGDWFAIIASALIFGLMHCNLMQIPFAFIAGIAIGYAVIATESVWTGVLIHFFNNAFSVTVSIVDDFYGMDSPQYMATTVIFYLLIVAGCVLAFIYMKMFPAKMKKSPLINQGKDFYGTVPMYSAKISLKTIFKEYLITAPMIIAFLIVVYETVSAALLYQ